MPYRTGAAAEIEVFEGVGHAFANLPDATADRCIAQMKDCIGRGLRGDAA